MYKNPELEKMTKEYLEKVRTYEIDFGDKDIQELKEIKQRLKPTTLCGYFKAIFDNFDRLLQLSVLEKVIRERKQIKWKMNLEKKAKYPQPHNIKIEGAENFNEAVLQHLITKYHHQLKYNTSKWRKRMYYSKD